VLDSIALERRGVPTVLFVTEVFEVAARAQAKQAGMPNLPIIVIPHRVGWQSEEEVRASAEEVLPEVLRRLTAG
jgi:hypothetical protein